MDITTNQLNAPVVAEPTAPYGISKYAKSYLDALKSNAEDVVAKSNAQFQVVKSYVESEVAGLDASLNAVKSELETAVADEAQARADAVTALDASLNAVKSDLETAVADETQARQQAVSHLKTDLEDKLEIRRQQLNMGITSNGGRIDALEAWKDANTDEISTEIDKAINSKVSQLSFDTIKQDLENTDSQIAQNLAGAITARTEKDAEHDTLLQRVEKYINTMLSTYDLVDANGNPLNSFADVVLVPPPQLLLTTADGITDIYSGDKYFVTSLNDYFFTFGGSYPNNFVSTLEVEGTEYPVVYRTTTDGGLDLYDASNGYVISFEPAQSQFKILDSNFGVVEDGKLHLTGSYTKV